MKRAWRRRIRVRRQASGGGSGRRRRQPYRLLYNNITEGKRRHFARARQAATPTGVTCSSYFSSGHSGGQPWAWAWPLPTATFRGRASGRGDNNSIGRPLHDQEGGRCTGRMGLIQLLDMISTFSYGEAIAATTCVGDGDIRVAAGELRQMAYLISSDIA